MQRSINAIKYLDASELYSMMTLNTATKTTTTSTSSSSNEDLQPFRVIDVRGSDYIGGHIKNCLHYPYAQLKRDNNYLGELKQELLSSLNTNNFGSAGNSVKCIFHCAMSQQRGPSAALLFLRSLSEEEINNKTFDIYILRGGFINWVNEGYGKNNHVTEDYLDYLWN